MTAIESREKFFRIVAKKCFDKRVRVIYRFAFSDNDNESIGYVDSVMGDRVFLKLDDGDGISIPSILLENIIAIEVLPEK